jgi:tripartite-type tricarboxylate transporter receptor subunit TctC
MTDMPPSTPEQFAATIQKDLTDWGALVKELDIPKQ